MIATCTCTHRNSSEDWLSVYAVTDNGSVRLWVHTLSENLFVFGVLVEAYGKNRNILLYTVLTV